MTALDWSHRVTDVGERGLTAERRATAEECVAVARDMGISQCTSVTARYELKPTVNQRFHVTGRVHAVIEQSCVLTLDPVREEIDAEIDLEFWPSAQIEQGEEIDIDALEHDDPEPIVSGMLDVGRVIYEILASQADPYPRLPGEELERTEAVEPAGQDDSASANPFAKLAALRNREPN